MTATLAVTAIDFYQRFLSPYKGFRCAHRVRHGRKSCSQFAKRLVQKVGLLRFVQIFRKRLGRCGAAARALRSDGPPYREPDSSRRRHAVADACDPGCIPDISGCDAASIADGAGGCDAPSVGDCGDCGGGCDLSF